MANTTIDALYPEFWAAAFDEMDAASLDLHNQISRKHEATLGKFGDTVNVPLVPDLADADNWTPGDVITSEGVTQQAAQLILNKSKKKTITLSGVELSLTPYDLIKEYGVPMAEKILESVNQEVYIEALKSKYFTNDPATAISEDKVVDLKTLLSTNKVVNGGRILVLSPDDVGTLLKTDAFQYANTAGDAGRAMTEGELARKFGFTVFENHIIADYTPADLTGAVNHSAGYVAGDTTMLVDAFNDDANPVRPGDMFKITGETNTPWRTITATAVTSSDTTSITFYPALVETVANNAVITITASRSALGFVPSAMAFASRPYAILPSGAGVSSFVTFVRGMPVRISLWHDGKLGLSIQFDVLFGVKLVNAKRMGRLIV